MSSVTRKTFNTEMTEILRGLCGEALKDRIVEKQAAQRGRAAIPD
jgi:hypothetical protein